MQISANKLLPYAPAPQRLERIGAKEEFQREGLKGEGREESAGQVPPLRESQPPSDEATLDYRQLVLQARYRRAGAEQWGNAEREAHRIGGETHRVQRALGAYRNNTGEVDEGGELLPRLDVRV